MKIYTFVNNTREFDRCNDDETKFIETTSTQLSDVFNSELVPLEDVFPDSTSHKHLSYSSWMETNGYPITLLAQVPDDTTYEQFIQQYPEFAL